MDRKPFIALFAVFLFSLSPALVEGSKKRSEPYLRRTAQDVDLILTGKMKRTLSKHNPKFRLWKLSEFVPSHLKEYYKVTSRQAPFAVVADFNGDGFKDAALYGHDDRNDLLVALLSTSSGYKAVEVERMGRSNPSIEWTETRNGKEYGLDNYLEHQPKGRIKLGGETEVLDLKRSGFVLNFHFKGGHLYHWKDGKFAKLTIGC